MSKEKESEYLQIGNTGINKAAVKKGSFKKFTETHGHLSFGVLSLEDVYIKCGGKIKS